MQGLSLNAAAMCSITDCLPTALECKAKKITYFRMHF